MRRTQKMGLFGVLLALMGTFMVFVNGGTTHATNTGGECQTIRIGEPYRVIRAAAGTSHVLGSADTSAYQGWQVVESGAMGSNNESVHPGNNIVISTAGGSGQITLNNIEGNPPGDSSGNITSLGSSLTATLIMGGDAVFSGGFTAYVKVCPPPPPEPQTLSVDGAIVCDVVENQAVYTFTGITSNPNGLEVVSRNVADGVVANRAFTFEVVYIDNLDKQQTATAAIAAARDCSPTVPSLEGTVNADCVDIIATVTTGDGDVPLKVTVALPDGTSQTVTLAPNSSSNVVFDARQYYGETLFVSFSTLNKGSGQEVTVPSEETCNPEPGTLIISGHITCAVVEDKAVYSFDGSINNPDELEILYVSHEDGVVANEPFTFQVDYRDNLGVVQTVTAEIAATADCTPPPPQEKLVQVCALNEGRIITIGETQLNATDANGNPLYGPVDAAECTPDIPREVETGGLLVGSDQMGVASVTSMNTLAQGSFWAVLGMLFASIGGLVVTPAALAWRRI